MPGQFSVTINRRGSSKERPIRFIRRAPDCITEFGSGRFVSDTMMVVERVASTILSEIDVVFADLLERDEIDHIIPAKLKEQTEDLRNEPEDRRLRRAILDSANNVLGKLAEAALADGRWIDGEVKDFAGRSWRSVKIVGAGSVALGAVGHLIGLSRTAKEFFTQMQTLCDPWHRQSQKNLGGVYSSYRCSVCDAGDNARPLNQ